MRLNLHLAFDGHCRAAFEYYERCLGGKAKIMFMMTYGDSPMAEKTSPELRGNIIHASLALGDDLLTGADAPPGRYQKPQGAAILLGVDDASEADRIYAALSENGSVQMPLQETFWALRFGILVDQFGVPWMINCGKPM